MKDYAHPEVLVDTQWLAEHLDDPKVRIVDIHLDPTLYESGHIPGAVFWPAIGTLLKPDWQINFDTQSVEDLCARSGIANDTTVVAYSEQNALARVGVLVSPVRRSCRCAGPERRPPEMGRRRSCAGDRAVGRLSRYL